MTSNPCTPNNKVLSKIFNELEDKGAVGSPMESTSYHGPRRTKQDQIQQPPALDVSCIPGHDGDYDITRKIQELDMTAMFPRVQPTHGSQRTKQDQTQKPAAFDVSCKPGHDDNDYDITRKIQELDMTQMIPRVQPTFNHNSDIKRNLQELDMSCQLQPPNLTNNCDTKRNFQEGDITCKLHELDMTHQQPLIKPFPSETAGTDYI